MSTSQLNPVTRREALERIQTNDYDVLVIGGGVTGAGLGHLVTVGKAVPRRAALPRTT
jgi:heterodisulfide reductase subunit A-like polyferredoxin